MIIKKLMIAILTLSFCYSLGAYTAENTISAPRQTLSTEDQELFIQQIRSILREFEYSKWESLPIQIGTTDGNARAIGDRLLIVGSQMYQQSVHPHLKAILGHELIHIEKGHTTAKQLWGVAGLGIISSIILATVTTCYSKSKKAGSLVALTYIPTAFLFNQLRLLHSRHQEKEADIESTTRWGTAQSLMEHLQATFNKHATKKLTINEIVQLKNHWSTEFLWAFEHPFTEERIQYLYPIAQAQKKLRTDKNQSK